MTIGSESIANHGSRLAPLFAAAAQDASRAIDRWTNGCVTLSFDEAIELPLEEAVRDVSSEIRTLIVLAMPDPLGGEIMLSFDAVAGQHLCHALLGDTWGNSSELTRSVLLETGNILACTYVNTLSRYLQTTLAPGVPQWIEDYSSSVLEQALLAQAMSDDRVLFCRTNFRANGQTLNWDMFFVPHPDLRQALDAVRLPSPVEHESGSNS